MGENLGVHGGGDATGLRVLLAGMVDAEQARSSRRDFRLGAVSESEERAGSNHAALLEDVEVAVPGDFAERQDRLRLQDFQFALKITSAIQDFSRERLIFRRGAAACCGDVGVVELQAVFAVFRGRLICETGFVKCSIEKIPGAVSGEHAPGAIRAVRCGSESKNHDLRLRVAEPWDGLAPVLPFAIRAALFARDFFPVFHEAVTFAASDNFLVQDAKLGSGFQHALAV